MKQKKRDGAGQGASSHQTKIKSGTVFKQLIQEATIRANKRANKLHQQQADK